MRSTLKFSALARLARNVRLDWRPEIAVWLLSWIREFKC